MSARPAPLEAAIEALDDPFHCSGTLAFRPVTLTLPDGDVLACGATDFVERLTERCEVAPFGDGERTRVDPAVRDALRLRSRGDTQVAGFSPSEVLPEIERVLCPHEELEARLLDVHVYAPGGRFARHWDTPRDVDAVGTLVVALPVAHAGGVLRLGAKGAAVDLDFGPDASRGALSWAAFFGDVDHEVLAVERGHRVTLAYALVATGRAREGAADRTGAVREALRALLADDRVLPRGGVLLVPCTRRVVVGKDERDEMPRSRLHGLDRELAEAASSLGLVARPRACLAVVDPDTREIDAVHDAVDLVRLRRPLTHARLASLGAMVTRTDDEVATDDDGEPMEVGSLARWLAPDAPQLEVRRPRAHAVLLHEALYSPTGYFGNEHFDACFYSFVAIEIEVGTLAQRGLPPVVAAAPLPRVRHAKFGEGEVLREDRTGASPTLEVRFADGTVRKLLERFVTPI